MGQVVAAWADLVQFETYIDVNVVPIRLEQNACQHGKASRQALWQCQAAQAARNLLLVETWVDQGTPR